MNNTRGKLEWFNGNDHALQMYRMLVDLLHTWDDLVDKDKELSEAEINNSFLIALVYLPSNPFYRQIQDQILPMWTSVVSAYAVANQYERNKDEHGIEIAHTLRYTAGHIVSYMVLVCNGYEKAKDIMPEVWKNMVCERFDEYRKEHLNAN